MMTSFLHLFLKANQAVFDYDNPKTYFLGWIRRTHRPHLRRSALGRNSISGTTDSSKPTSHRTTLCRIFWKILIYFTLGRPCTHPNHPVQSILRKRSLVCIIRNASVSVPVFQTAMKGWRIQIQGPLDFVQPWCPDASR